MRLANFFLGAVGSSERASVNVLASRWVATAARRYPLLVSMLLLLSLLTSLADGISITLLIPLLMLLFGTSSVATSNSNFLENILGQFAVMWPEHSRLYMIAAVILGMMVIRTVLHYWDQVIVNDLSGKISHLIRSKIHHNLLNVEFSYIQNNEKGKFLNTLETEAWRTTEVITKVFGLFTNVCMVGAFGLLLLLISVKLTAITIVSIVAVSLVRRQIDRQVHRLSELALRAAEALSVHACEVLDAMRMIRAFNRIDMAQRKYEEASSALLKVEMQICRLSNRASGFNEVAYAVLFAALLLVTIYFQIQQASMLAFLALLRRMQPHVKAIDEVRTHLNERAGSIMAVTRLSELQPLLNQGSGTFIPSDCIKSIDFQNVSFSYEGKDAERRNALENVTLNIPVGKTTAIVGKTGAGKTTLANLLFRFHDPDEGQVLIDGISLEQFDAEWWRGQMAVAGQDADLISGTVRENIAFAKPEATDNEVHSAAEAAQIHDFIINLPNGYDTKIGARGLLLSGGQRQRIELARAMLSARPILILDEATNALDSVTEQEVLESLQALHGQLTIILIAHRAKMMQTADYVVVMSEGRVAERGTPKELYRREGFFRRMVQLQELSFDSSSVPVVGSSVQGGTTVVSA